MSTNTFIILEERGILAIAGDDARSFLQGLISNDIEKVSDGHAMHAALLTPQGKYLHDFFVAQGPDSLLLDCERERLPDLMKRLKLYKLRAKVDLVDQSDDWTVAALVGDDALKVLGLEHTPGAAKQQNGGVLFTDPRLADLGARAMLPATIAATTLGGLGFAQGQRMDYDQRRIRLGVPDGSRDLIVDKSILLESGFDELNGVDWNKGCYMGQELTARTKYRGLIKKRLMPVEIYGDLPEFGVALTLDGKDVGELRSAVIGPDGAIGIALVRLEHVVDGAVFDAGGATVTPRKPDWANF